MLSLATRISHGLSLSVYHSRLLNVSSKLFIRSQAKPSTNLKQEKVALITLGLAPDELNDYKVEAVRLTYFNLAKKLHPDSSSEQADRKKFEEATNAYQTLMVTFMITSSYSTGPPTESLIRKQSPKSLQKACNEAFKNEFSLFSIIRLQITISFSAV